MTFVLLSRTTSSLSENRSTLEKQLAPWETDSLDSEEKTVDKRGETFWAEFLPRQVFGLNERI